MPLPLEARRLRSHPAAGAALPDRAIQDAPSHAACTSIDETRRSAIRPTDPISKEAT